MFTGAHVVEGSFSSGGQNNGRAEAGVSAVPPKEHNEKGCYSIDLIECVEIPI